MAVPRSAVSAPNTRGVNPSRPATLFPACAGNLQELSAAVPICRVVLGLLHPLSPAFFRLWVRAQRRDPNAFRRLPKQDSVCPVRVWAEGFVLRALVFAVASR